MHCDPGGRPRRGTVSLSPFARFVLAVGNQRSSPEPLRGESWARFAHARVVRRGLVVMDFARSAVMDSTWQKLALREKPCLGSR